jgi:hypothetical protein
MAALTAPVGRWVEEPVATGRSGTGRSGTGRSGNRRSGNERAGCGRRGCGRRGCGRRGCGRRGCGRRGCGRGRGRGRTGRHAAGTGCPGIHRGIGNGVVKGSAHRSGRTHRPGRGGRGGGTLGPLAPSPSSFSRVTGRLLRVGGPTGCVPLRFTGDRVDRRPPDRGGLDRRSLGPDRRRWRRRGRAHPQGNRVLRRIDGRWSRWLRRRRRRRSGSKERAVLGRAPPAPRPPALGRSLDCGALQLTRPLAVPRRPSGYRIACGLPDR